MMARDDQEVYVYALAEPGLPRRLRISGHSLRTLPIAGIDAVVESRREPPAPTSDTLREQHALVVELSHRCAALLPARFGTLGREALLRSAIAKHRASIAAALRQVRNREQMTIRVFGGADDSIPEEDRATGTAFLTSRRERARHVPPEVHVIRRELESCIAAQRIDPGQRGLRVTVFHLVSRKRLAVYRRRASALESKLAPHRVVVSGPWPAFAFAPELF